MFEIFKQEIKLFYSYAHVDKGLRDRLEKHLSGLKWQYRLVNWYDRDILPGQKWEQTIAQNLNTAHIILLLISSDFMDSDYCSGIEMNMALERHEAGSCRVIPILLRSVVWEKAPFSNLQVLPTDAKFVTDWRNRDKAFTNIVEGIS